MKSPSLNGFTLLETIIALALITTVAVGPASLIIRGIFSAPLAKNKLIAANLAQEGIELVRLVRDNNIICDALNGAANWEWNRDPRGGFISDGYYALYVNSLTSISKAHCKTAEDIQTPLLSPTSPQGEAVKFDGTLYGSSGETTPFRRRVFIDFSPASPDSGIPGGDQADITSRVSWEEKGKGQVVELKERFYNWR